MTVADPSPPHQRGPAWYAGPVPETALVGQWRFVPLTTAMLAADYAAVMATADHLRWWSDSTWPTDEFTLQENEQDLQWHADEHRERVAFTFSVVDAASPSSSPRVVGCLYIRPFVSACSTRGIDCPAALVDRLDAVARGWLVDDQAGRRDDFRDAVVSWLRSPPWEFPDVWWQERTAEDAGGSVSGDDHVVVGRWSFRRGSA